MCMHAGMHLGMQGLQHMRGFADVSKNAAMWHMPVECSTFPPQLNSSPVAGRPMSSDYTECLVQFSSWRPSSASRCRPGSRNSTGCYILCGMCFAPLGIGTCTAASAPAPPTHGSAARLAQSGTGKCQMQRLEQDRLRTGLAQSALVGHS